MEEKTLHAIMAIAMTALALYLKALLIPIIILIFVMLLDYSTGITYAWRTKTLNSKIGMNGIMKKVGYLIMVGVAMIVDWLISSALTQINISIIMPAFAMIIIMWIIINELISICENIAKFGVKLPKFLTVILDKLKNKIEEKGNDIKNDNKKI